MRGDTSRRGCVLAALAALAFGVPAAAEEPAAPAVLPARRGSRTRIPDALSHV